MCRDQNAGWSRSVNIDNSSVEMVDDFKYLEAALTIKNSVQE